MSDPEVLQVVLTSIQQLKWRTFWGVRISLYIYRRYDRHKGLKAGELSDQEVGSALPFQLSWNWTFNEFRTMLSKYYCAMPYDDVSTYLK
jgi:hypothetical protein